MIVTDLTDPGPAIAEAACRPTCEFESLTSNAKIPEHHSGGSEE